jgi:hypothetical protein
MRLVRLGYFALVGVLAMLMGAAEARADGWTADPTELDMELQLSASAAGFAAYFPQADRGSYAADQAAGDTSAEVSDSVGLPSGAGTVIVSFKRHYTKSGSPANKTVIVSAYTRSYATTSGGASGSGHATANANATVPITGGEGTSVERSSNGATSSGEVTHNHSGTLILNATTDVAASLNSYSFAEYEGTGSALGSGHITITWGG